jgi:hypothetical protein
MLAALEGGVKAKIPPYGLYRLKNLLRYSLRSRRTDAAAHYFAGACPYYDDLSAGHFTDLDELAEHRLDIGADPIGIRLLDGYSIVRFRSGISSARAGRSIRLHA